MHVRSYLTVPLLLLLNSIAHAGEPKYPPPSEVKASFLKRLDRPRVPLEPTVDSKIDKDLILDVGSFASEKKADGTTERVPILIARPRSAKPLPAVIVLHGTGGTKESQLAFMKELVKRNIIGVAIDARYHGARSSGAKGSAAYNEAIVRAWKTLPGAAMEHPFYYDTCWDLWRTVDYLQTRKDIIDGGRIGMIGFSMGGIQTWLAASVDERIKVTVPAIAVQSFRWSLENEQWQGRAKTINLAHQAAAKDLGESAVNQRVCRALWTKIIPGILDEFDCPSMLRLFAGRPLLIVSGEKDPNCPIGGARIAFAAAEKAYAEAGATEKLRINVAPVGHTVPPEQRTLALDWFERWLR